MPTRNVNLTPELDDAIARRVASGSYENASEVVRAALRALEAQEQSHQARLAFLRGQASSAFAELDRGEHIEVSADALVDDIEAELGL